jgi:hypothetical protein
MLLPVKGTSSRLPEKEGTKGAQKTMKKIYISGRITGDQNYREKFLEEEIRLVRLGYKVVNPAAIISGTMQDLRWSDAMRIVIREMMLCEGISLLPDWKKSRGAKIEVRLARELKIEVRSNEKWD